MAIGKPPFYTALLKDLIAMIVESDCPRLDGFSPQFNDLISKLLEKDPIKRLSWDEIKKHPFWTCTQDFEPEFTKRVYPH